jgi:HSP20 family protein
MGLFQQPAKEIQTMRYRRIGYRYTMVVASGQLEPFADVWWVSGANLVSGHPRWRPATDVLETDQAIVAIIELAGINDEELEVLLYENALVINGERSLPYSTEAERYYAFEIRQGPFRVEIPLPVDIDGNAVEARYERGLLQVRLPKLRGGKAHGGGA